MNETTERPYACGFKCRICHELGCHEDTRTCVDCERVIDAETAPLRARLAEAEARITELEARADALREAFKPFDVYAEVLRDENACADLRIGYYRPSPTVGDCLNASAALAAPSSGAALTELRARERAAERERCCGLVCFECGSGHTPHLLDGKWWHAPRENYRGALCQATYLRALPATPADAANK